MDKSPSDLLEKHAPSSWRSELPPTRWDALLQTKDPVKMIVLAADIRSSTFLMKEAIDFNLFAEAIGNFVTSASNELHKERAWFDKFTGDGFLVYWIVDDRPIATYLEEVAIIADVIINVFRNRTEAALRRNSRNLPARLGLSIGLDAGPGYLARIAGDITIIGSPVVGAVRMVSSAEPYECVVNNYLGQCLLTVPDLLAARGYSLQPVIKTTKEYENGQHAFLLQIPARQLQLASSTVLNN